MLPWIANGAGNMKVTPHHACKGRGFGGEQLEDPADSPARDWQYKPERDRRSLSAGGDQQLVLGSCQRLFRSRLDEPACLRSGTLPRPLRDLDASLAQVPDEAGAGDSHPGVGDG